MEEWSIYLVTKYNKLLFLRNRHNLLECAPVYDCSGGIVRITEVSVSFVVFMKILLVKVLDNDHLGFWAYQALQLFDV